MSEPNGCPTPGACSAAAQTAELTKERNEWRSIATDNLSALQTATARIAAAQAHIARLRGELTHINDYWNGSRNDRAMWDALTHIDDVVTKALAIPTDTSELDARLEQERERCADLVDDREMFGGAATIIRRMK